MSYPVLDIANKLLHHASEAGELMTNLKLQKMLYYQQGFHLACFDTPLFDDDIEAWMYGPVVPAVYEQFKAYGSTGIPPVQDERILTDEEEGLFNEVFDIYNEFSASGLMKMTHSEEPWKSTPARVGSVISREKLTSFFKTRLA